MTPATTSAPVSSIIDLAAALRVPTRAGEVSPEASPASRLILHVTIPGEPVAQGRPIAGRWKAKDGREGTTLRDPGKSRGWKAEAAALIYAEIVRLTDAGCVLFPAPCAVAVHIAAIFPCPVSAHRKREPLARAWAVSNGRNDCDNVAKACLDALTRAGCWSDDGQVVALYVEKIRAAQGEAPRVCITVSQAAPIERGAHA